MSTPDRVIIVQTAFLGDVVLTLPLCAAVRERLPNAEVVLVTTPAAAEFVRGLDVVHSVVAFDKRGHHRSLAGQGALARSLSSGGTTVVLVPHKSLRTALFVRSIKAARVVTFKDAASRWIATDVIPYPSHLHDTQRHMALLAPLLSKDEALPTVESLLPLRFSEDLPHDLQPWSDLDGAPRVVLAPSTVWPTKQWPVEKMREMAMRLVHEGMQVAVIGDASVRGCMDGIVGVRDLIGRTTLRQAAAVIASADCLVANDSAPVHLASLQNSGVVAIFGPTVPEFGFGPLGTRARVVQQCDLECRPCSAHGGRRCPLGTHACMMGIDVETVRNSVQSILAHDVNRHAKPQEPII
ncbi:MAG: glycosyltransferase family 9 protein [Candidatus Kapabacteria bacterium]|nr:glycosyltransferase family 9 protein [Candidatus Kapabacteria bacterium]